MLACRINFCNTKLDDPAVLVEEMFPGYQFEGMMKPSRH
jgi:hypothetical protein